MPVCSHIDGKKLKESASSVTTPTPSNAPAYSLGPTNAPVYYDPWCAVYLGAIGATAALRPASLSRRPRLLFVAALAIGSVLASPWLYLAARELIT